MGHHFFYLRKFNTIKTPKKLRCAKLKYPWDVKNHLVVLKTFNMTKISLQSLWEPVISGVLLRLYGMGLRPNDPIRGYWQVWGWSVKVIMEVALTEELKVIMVIPNLFEVKSHLGIFVRGGLKPSYPSEYSFNVT